MLNDFENFCKMRMGLREKDDLLLTHRFENIHREADRSTRYYLNHCTSLDAWLVVCRYNRPSTLKLCSWNEQGSIDISESVKQVRLAEQSGISLNTGVYAATSWMKRSGTAWEDLEVIQNYYKPEIERILDRSNKLSEVIRELIKLDRIGTFLATQWGLNLSYWYDITIDEVPFNNGAKQGLKLLESDAKSILQMEWTRECAMTIVALEHALCAYQKYVKLRKNPRVLPKYKPSNETLLPIKLPKNWITHYDSFGLLDRLYEIYE